MEGDCNVYAHSSLWMRPTRPDQYNAKMVYTLYLYFGEEKFTLQLKDLWQKFLIFSLCNFFD